MTAEVALADYRDDRPSDGTGTPPAANSLTQDSAMDRPRARPGLDARDPGLDPNRPLYGLGGGTDPALAPLDQAVADAFRARADAHMTRGEYHLALADYGRSLNATPPGVMFRSERNPGASDGRRAASRRLGCFFSCGGDPERLPKDAAGELRDAVRSARLPAGHLVVADGGGVVAVYPPTDEGRRAAVGHADGLAADPHARFVLDNLYLADCDEFDAVVYACEAGRAAEVHRAAPRPKPADRDPAGG